MKPDYIKRFEDMGLGLFVHFGLFSVMGKGEWYLKGPGITEKDIKHYYEVVPSQFKVKKNWAKRLVAVAKKAGAKYITLTTRHHDGFSLFDTCGLNEFDAPHSAAGRDLIKEFVDECNKAGIVPFFYHTLMDWWVPEYKSDFAAYIDYLVASVEILCKNYGKIGGFWFDGYWDKPDADWQFDRLYKTIRKYQPEAIIINNTGLDAGGEVTHYDIDAVTFERGTPALVSYKDGKDRAGEVCDGITDHWGYAKYDVKTKPATQLISTFIDCRYNNCNYLINVGPLPNGDVQPLEVGVLSQLGLFNKAYKNVLFGAKKAEVQADNALVFEKDGVYYAVMKDIPMVLDKNVTRSSDRPNIVLHTDKRILGARWMDNKEKCQVDQKNKIIFYSPFDYGCSLYARIASFRLK